MLVKVRRLLGRLQINRAVAYGSITYIWRTISGPATLLLMVKYFTPETQGYYFTFVGLMALQTFAELGLGNVVINFSSHEWSKLRMESTGQIVGDRSAISRLASLAQFSIKWYSIGACIFTMTLAIVGVHYFSGKSMSGVDWVGPWIALCITTGITIALSPLWFLLEGCNQTSNVYLFRLFQGLGMVLASWTAIIMGLGLWAAAISSFTGMAIALCLIFGRYRNFFSTLLLFAIDNVISWKNELLPMQWRLAAASFAGYFIGAALTPIIFHFLGPIEAGKFGMTYGLVVMSGGAAAMWGTVRAAEFGILASQRKYREMDCLLRKLLIINGGVLFVLATLVWIFILLINLAEFEFARRLLSPLPSLILIIGMVASLVCHPISIYLRAQRREPFLVLSVVMGGAMLLATIMLSNWYGTTGAVSGYAMINMFIGVPWTYAIFIYAKRKWQVTSVSG